MDPSAIAREIAEQFVTVWHTPIPFLAVCIALWFGMRWFVRGQFETRLSNAQSTIDMLERKIAHRQVDEAVAIAAVSAGDAPVRSSPKPQLPRRKLAPGEAITRDQISEIFRVNIEAKAKELISPFIGTQMDVSGNVAQISENDDGYVVSVSSPGSTDLVFCRFSGDNKAIAPLNKGDALAVKGTLTSASPLWTDLADCELIAAW